MQTGLITAIFGCVCLIAVDGQNFGTLLGSFSQPSQHAVSGTVYMVDSRRIRIRNFNYDGQGPDAYFWYGTSQNPDSTGLILPDEMGSMGILGSYNNADIVLTFPEGTNVCDIKWLSVWCRQFRANFAHISISCSNKCVPASRNIGQFSRNAHGVMSQNVIVMDSRTVRIEDFSYDGLGPDAFFLAGTGDIKASNGRKIPDENGSLQKLASYSNKTIELKFPPDLRVADVQWISVYCVQASSNFGNVNIPDDLCVPPYMEMAMYYGEEIGSLQQKDYGVMGKIYVVDNSRIRLRHFSYTGKGPDAFFYIGVKGQDGTKPTEGGVYLLNEMGSEQKLGVYQQADIVLSLPQDVKSNQIAWFSVWCKSVGVDFGSIIFPGIITIPAEVNIGQLSRLKHEVSSGDIVVLDKRTIMIPQFTYDGQGPDAFFLVGKGTPKASGVMVPDENGSLMKLKRYSGKDIKLRLPGGTSVDDIDWLSVYCKSVGVDFGNVMFPAGTLSVPPYIPPPAMLPLANCEAMNNKFNVAWEVKNDKIVFEFTGALDGDAGYMSFGVSGSDSASVMVGSDAMVVYLDGQPKVEDYTMNAKSLCSDGDGVCPDTAKSGINNLEMIDGEIKDGVTRVRFQRPLSTGDATVDKTIVTDREMYTVWATGSVNDQKQITKHTEHLRGPQKINFGRSRSDNCKAIAPSVGEKEVVPWPASKIGCKETTTFRAKIGPTGGKKGYSGITGQISWGIAWFLNGYLIPEVTVVRGETYTFHVEGGQDPSKQARYHPLYITDDPIGGYETKSQAQKDNVKLFAGTMRNASGLFGTDGRFCEYTSSANPEDYESFDAYKKTLTEECDQSGSAGMFTWTPDADTPDLVYYQCFTHNYLGWKIRVVNKCPDTEKKASNLDQDAVETALFLLVAVGFVLLLAVLMLVVNYVGLRNQMKKLQEKSPL